ncbi:MAG TPA: 2-succinyl-6-hydroxy-2,4-cyclohexadiene-1-carboxylate synthase [Solirubrobacteraceae bacterium]|nr:2-succinyl-6-hydroxy-2,4-cyclohexadiene-1-carboxylate synthase [Solirubrobacteraceae bacterium]
MPETLVLLHGFSGTRHAWDGVVERIDGERYRPLALDLPGHGEASAFAGAITFDACVETVLASSPERFALCGYSLGGRIALHVALTAPERVSRLVLVSCSPGIEDDGQRAERHAADERLAKELESIPFEQFIEKWRTQPLFAGDPPEAGERAREDQRRNEPIALAKAMRGLGTGEMTPLWNRLGELQMPSVFVAGERDAKFRAIGQRMVALMPDANFVVIPGGHALALESPEELARMID